MPARSPALVANKSAYINSQGQLSSEAVVDRTTTSDGLGTGQILAGETFINVTSANANNILTLPPPVIGTKITFYVGANGCELRTTSPTTIGIGAGVGANAESAIPATTVVHITCTTLTNWVGFQQAAAGTLALVEVAA